MVFPLFVFQFRRVLTEAKRRENPFVEEDDGGAKGDPDTANGRINRLLNRGGSLLSGGRSLLTSRIMRDGVLAWEAATSRPRG
jgi:hypothetical protein